MSVLALLIAFFALTRRRWLAILLLIAFNAPNYWSAHFSYFQWLGLAIGVFATAVYGFLFLRFGVLATASSIFAGLLLSSSPVTADPSSPYFGTSLFTLLVVAVLCVYGAWGAVGRKARVSVEDLHRRLR